MTREFGVPPGCLARENAMSDHLQCMLSCPYFLVDRVETSLNVAFSPLCLFVVKSLENQVGTFCSRILLIHEIHEGQKLIHMKHI